MIGYSILNRYKYSLLSLLCLIFLTCKKNNEKLGFLSDDLKYQYSTQEAYVGKGLWIGIPLEFDDSTLPVVCSIVAIRDGSGKSTDEIRYPLQTKFWKSELTEEEKDIKKVISKFKYVSRPALDIDPGNGRLIIYPEAKSDKLLPGIYHIDIMVKGTGSEKILKNAITLKIIESPPFSWIKNTVNDQEVGGDVATNYSIEFKRLGNPEKLIVKFEGPDGQIFSPKIFMPAPNYLKHSSFDKMIGVNPFQYNSFPDHLDMSVIYPLPFPNGIQMQRIQLETFDKDGSYFAIYFSFAIYEPGTWEMKIKFEGNAKTFNNFIKEFRK